MIESGGEGDERSYAPAPWRGPGGPSEVSRAGDPSGEGGASGEREPDGAGKFGAAGESGAAGDASGDRQVSGGGGPAEGDLSGPGDLGGPGDSSGAGGVSGLGGVSDDRRLGGGEGGGAEDDLSGSGGLGGPGGLSGEERVRASLAALERLSGLPVREHVAAFEEVFAGLETTLATASGEARPDAPERVQTGDHRGGGGAAGVFGGAIGR